MPTTTAFEDPESFWNEKLSGEEYHFGRLPNVFLQHAAKGFHASSTILCVADGEGRNSTWLAQQGHQVTAFDISSVGLSKARRLSEACGVQVDYQRSSIEEWHWEAARYDVVAAIFIQFATPITRRWLWGQIHQTLKPGGLLVLQGYTPAQLALRTGGPSNPEHLYTKVLLEDELSAFSRLDCSEYEQVLQEGPGHNGRSALMRAVARK